MLQGGNSTYQKKPSSWAVMVSLKMDAYTVPDDIRSETFVKTKAAMDERLSVLRSKTDRLFAVLMVLQWLFGIVAAFWISPLTWAGTHSETHPHVWSALFLGGILTLVPCGLVLLKPGSLLTREVIAVAQMLWSALLIHLTGGRIETHFHVFGSLAFLAWYRDWRVVVTATVVVASDHLLRGIFWPQSVYGVLSVAPWRTVEHGAWVIFEDTFLLISIRQSLNEIREIATKQTELSQRNDELHDYTKELEMAKAVLQQQAATLEAQAGDLQAARNQADQANRLKSEFLANMSHEIRTPMAAILGFVEVLAEDAATPDQVEAVSVVQHNGRYLLEILNDILDLSKIEAGEATIEKFRCQPHQIVAQLASLMRVRAAAKDLRLDVEYVGSIPELILTDPTALRQILVNLISNAIKFTAEGCVRLVIYLSPDASEPQLCFEIIDTGIGISNDQLTRLFRPFSQADSSTRRKYGGTGLGLAISKNLSALLGGSLDVESQLEKGSRFTLVIPTGPLDGVRLLQNIDEVAQREDPHVQRAGREVRVDCRVLLAEDGTSNQRLLTRFLTKAGADVTLADNGQRAVDLAIAALEQQRPFDLILMDMQMPVMDGYEATRYLRSAGYAGAIIALTAHAMSGDREKCLAAGCSGYATKPIERDFLLRLVVEHTNRLKARFPTTV